MFEDERREDAELLNQKIAYVTRDSRATYYELKKLRAKVDVPVKTAPSGVTAREKDLKRRLRDSYNALQREKERTANLEAELVEVEKRIQALRSSRTMRAGRVIAKPYAEAKRLIIKFSG